MSLFGEGDVVYLYLPLAHVFAQLIQADCIEVGAAIAYWGGDATQIVARARPGQADRAAVGAAHLREGVRGGHGHGPAGRRGGRGKAIALGLKVRQARERGEEVSAEEAAEFEQVDGEMFALVRGIFGGKIKLAISGAAPIAPEILEFFYAAGVPVFEGWGMTETTSIGTLNLPDAYKFGTIGRPVAGCRHPHRRGRRDRDGRRR